MNNPTKLQILSELVTGNKAKKLDVLHLIAAFLARKVGVRLYNRNLLWYRDHSYQKLWDDFPVPQPVINDRRYNLMHLATSIKDVPGDTVECGVLRGESSYLIMKTNAGTGKTHHIFDSFDGLSEPEDTDHVESDKNYHWKKHDLAISEHQVRQNLCKFSNMHMYKGWIPERFNKVANKKFSFVHVDVDLYKPTYDSFAFFYPRLSPGGMIVCDDYGFLTCPGAFRAVNEYMGDHPEYPIHLSTGQCVIVKK